MPIQNFRKIIIDEQFDVLNNKINYSTHIGAATLDYLTSSKCYDVIYNYYDSSDISCNKINKPVKYIVNDAATINYLKYTIRLLTLNRENFVERMSQIIYCSNNFLSEKCCMYLFKKCNKILGITVYCDNIITDHPIDNIFNCCFEVSVKINKILLQRDLHHSEYIKLFRDKMASNCKNIQPNEIVAIKNFLLDNLDQDSLPILIDLIMRYEILAERCGELCAIVDVLAIDYYQSAIIDLNNVNVIMNVIKIAAHCYNWSLFEEYIKHIDLNTITIEEYIKYFDCQNFYDFFDKLLTSNIYTINIRKLFDCCSAIIKNIFCDHIPLFVYFIKKYYSLGNDIMSITFTDHSDLPIDNLRDAITHDMNSFYLANYIVDNIEFIKYIDPAIFSTNSCELSRYYATLCGSNSSDDSYIKAEIDNNIKCGLLDHHKIINDISKYKSNYDVNNISSVLKSLEKICEQQQYLTIDDFDYIFMKSISDFLCLCDSKIYVVKTICNIINSLFPSTYSEYKNHYVSLLLSLAIDYVIIDGDYVVLFDDNIAIHIDDLIFYPYYALLNTSNPVLIDYIIDNYMFDATSLGQLLSYYDVYRNNDQYYYLFIKLGKKYSDILKQQSCDKFCCINYKIIDNINSTNN
jgi:hypothetical protein